MDVGHLPEGESFRLDGGAELPPGRLVYPRMFRSIPGKPVLWATDDSVENAGALWLSLNAGAPESGLVPLILDVLDPADPLGRPWDSGELDPKPSPIPQDLDEVTVFRLAWRAEVPISLLSPEDRPRIQRPGQPPIPDFEEDWDEATEFRRLVAPWGPDFPGLAPAERIEGDVEGYRSAACETPPGRVGLVATAHPGEMLYQIGWIGAVNHFISETGSASLSVMARSWADRFGASLLRLGFQTMEFLVQRPPSSEAGALRVGGRTLCLRRDGRISGLRVLAPR